MSEVLLVGLDAASDPKKFGYAVGFYRESVIHVSDSGVLGKDRLEVLRTIAAALRMASRAVIAVDAPLGWPAGMRSLAYHRAGLPAAVEKNHMFRRRTDCKLRQEGHQPLEVGADKIARAAHEALAVLEELRVLSGRSLDLVWDQAFEGAGIVEVYPAATLRAMQMPCTRYKEAGCVPRRRIAEQLEGSIPHLSARTDARSDEFDALLCLLCAVDFIEARCPPIPSSDVELAQREGWIWVRRDERPERRTSR